MRTVVGVIAIILTGASAAAASQAPPGSAQAGDIDFMGARLGMGLAEWKALAYPGRDPDQVAPTCSQPDPRTAVCTYAARSGGVDLPPTLPLTKTYLVRNPTYDFVDGRLSKVEFRTSIDAFDDLSARFEARYGPASQILRDDVKLPDGFDLPRVRKIWRTPGGSVEIIDPSTRPTLLEVQFARPLTSPH